MATSKSKSSKQRKKSTNLRAKEARSVSSKESFKSKETLSEKGPRYYRNFNLAVGSVALIGAAIAPPVGAALLGTYAAINFAQAAAGEGVLRYVRGRKKKKSKLAENSK